MVMVNSFSTNQAFDEALQVAKGAFGVGIMVDGAAYANNPFRHQQEEVLAALRDSAMAEVEALTSALPPEDKIRIRGNAHDAIGKACSRSDVLAALACLQAEAAQSIAYNNADRADQNLEDRQAQMAKLWGEINDGIRQTVEGVHELSKANIFTPDEDKEWSDRFNKILAMQDGPEKQKKLAALYNEYDARLEQKQKEYAVGSPEWQQIQHQRENTAEKEKQFDKLAAMAPQGNALAQNSQLAAENEKVIKAMSTPTTTEPSSNSLLSSPKANERAVHFDGDHSTAVLGQLATPTVTQAAPQKNSLLLG